MSDAPHFDVAIVGGGPAGCSAAVFTAREGLDTVVFDRGRSSLRRCAYLENYLGFPEGIDVETLYGLFHDHAEAAGCEIVPDLVSSVDRATDGEGVEDGAGLQFELELESGDPVTARRVVAATRYDGEYLRGLDDEPAMFEVYEHHGGTEERFDRDYAGRDGTTPVERLYVASPAAESDAQAIVAAGRGARVGRRVVTDARCERGWWEDVADRPDWVRREAELDAEWTDRERWVEWFEEQYGDDAPIAVDCERFEHVRASVVDGVQSTYIGDEERAARADRGHRALARRLDEGAIVEEVGAETIVEEADEAELLEVMDDDVIAAYLADGHEAGVGSSER